jgi:hypothetical protein
MTLPLLLLLLLPSITSSFSISVYDNVITPSTCQTLHKLTLQHTQRSHDGSSIFYRSEQQQQQQHSNTQQQRLTPIENAIDSILRQLNDTSPMVEYWSRSNYINLDAHSDIDENTLKEEGVLRCPRHGHVLYLQIANCDEVDGSNCDASTATEEEDNKHNNKSRMGPTVVFNRKVAWGSVTPRTIPSSSSTAGLASHNSPINMKDRVQEYIVDVENYWDEETKRQYGLLDKNNNNADDGGGGNSNNVKEGKMVIVPAVNGRLLRFDGAAFHSVPKPPHRYLLSEDELLAYLEKDCEEDCEEDDEEDDYWDDEEDYWDNNDDDDYEKEDLSQQRSVILFNTWPAGSSGPRGVLPDCVVEAVPDGIVLEDDDNTSIENDRIAEQWKKWKNDYGPNAEKLHCTPAHDWKLCVVDDLDNDDGHKTEVQVPLMGNPTRRGTSKTKALLQGRIKESAFYDGRKVSMATLREL